MGSNSSDIWFGCCVGGQSSDVTSLRPALASGAAADRSDVYSGSVNVQGRFPPELFTIKPLHPAAPMCSPCIQHDNDPVTCLTLDLHVRQIWWLL